MKIILQVCAITLLLAGFCQNSFAQRADIKNSTIPRKDLPKLEKVMIFNDDKGVIKAPEKDDYGTHISDTEAYNRSTSDGKISRSEERIIERAKRMPQEK